MKEQLKPRTLDQFCDERSQEDLSILNREFIKKYTIKIEFLDRGCVVHVGCRAIAFEDVNTAISELNRYVQNPYKVQNEWVF